jgi:hypothetical protein
MCQVSSNRPSSLAEGAGEGGKRGEKTYAGNTQILNGRYSVTYKRGANRDVIALSNSVLA